MPPMNYARWNHLDSGTSSDSSSAEESFASPSPPTSPRQPIVKGQYAVPDPPLPRDPEFRREVLRELAELMAFATQHAPPSSKAMKTWLRLESRGECSPCTSQNFFKLMLFMGWTRDKIGWLFGCSAKWASTCTGEADGNACSSTTTS